MNTIEGDLSMNQKIKEYILPAIAAASGVLGALLEVWLLYLDRDGRGLIPEAHPAGLFLWVLGVLAAALLFLLTRKITGKVRSYVRTFPASVPGAVGSAIAAVGAAGLGLQSLLSRGDALTVICGVLGVLAAGSLGFTAWARFRGFRPNAVFHTLVCLFFAAWTVSHYRLWSGDPRLAQYCFPLLANITMMLAAYHRAAFDLRMGNRRSYQLYRLLGVFCCITAIPAGGPAYGAFAAWMLLNPAVSDTPAPKAAEQ